MKYDIIHCGKDDYMNKKILAYTIITFLTLIYLFVFSSYFVSLTNLPPVLFNIISSIIVFFYLDIAYKLYIKKYQLYKREIFFVFATYLVVFFYLLFFKSGEVVDSSTLDFIPLFFYHQDYLQYIILVGNIILFVPIGYFYHRYNLKFNLIFILLLSFLIEGSQYFLKVGVFDLSDIVLYIIGFYIGYFYYKIIQPFSKKYPNISYDVRLVFSLYIVLFIITLVISKIVF